MLKLEGSTEVDTGGMTEERTVVATISVADDTVDEVASESPSVAIAVC